MTGQLVVMVAGVTVLAGEHPTPSLLKPMPLPTSASITPTHPARLAGDLSQREIRRLHAATQTVLRGAIATGGSSFGAYINDFRGWAGYLDHAEVFRRQGQPCPVCGTTTIRTKAAGRGALRRRNPGQPSRRSAPRMPRVNVG
jgi:hypothetical protein